MHDQGISMERIQTKTGIVVKSAEPACRGSCLVCRLENHIWCCLGLLAGVAIPIQTDITLIRRVAKDLLLINNSSRLVPMTALCVDALPSDLPLGLLTSIISKTFQETESIC